MQYVSDVHGIKKADRLTSEHVRDFLLSKTGVKLATFRRYCAALTKFDSALSKLLDRQPQWNGILKDFRESAPVALESEQPARAYRQPLSLVAQIDDERMRLIAELQWQCGLRVSEACNIKSHQMKGITIDNTEKQTGMIEIKGKGGKVRQVPVSIEIYTNLQNRLDHGPWAVDPAAYRVSLRQAAHRSGQEYARHGTHGLRWNYAQSLMDNLIRENVAYEVALTQISKLLGHERAGITCLYLRKG
jgi:integrase